jgi:CBS domain-containing protein
MGRFLSTPYRKCPAVQATAGIFPQLCRGVRGRHRNAFDIKSAMQPIVDLARIYALKNRISATNTQERLENLHQEKVLSWEEYNELDQAYSFLMQQRFLRQISAILEEKRSPDNYVNPKKLSNIEQTLLKEIFRRIEKFQSRLEFEFTGLA